LARAAHFLSSSSSRLLISSIVGTRYNASGGVVGTASFDTFASGDIYALGQLSLTSDGRIRPGEC
jgi:hypothetical protein